MVDAFQQKKFFFSNILNGKKLQAIRTFFKEFCANSSIHGVRYFTERGRHWTERLWWITAFTLSVWFCADSIGITWTAWLKNPVSLSFTDKPALISEIPFPTIILCPETKISMSTANISSWNDFLEDLFFGYDPPRKSKNYKEMLAQFSDSNTFELIQSLAQICRLPNPFALSHNGHSHDTIDISVYDMIDDIYDSLEMLNVWAWQQYAISSWSRLIYSDEGICISFNALNSHEVYTNAMAPELMIVEDNPNASRWSFEDGYISSSDRESYPYRSFNTKIQYGFFARFDLKNMNDSENTCDGRLPGSRLFVSVPGEHPITSQIRGSEKFVPIPFHEEVRIKLKPTLTTTSENLRSYDSNVRGCIFNSESHLRFFKTYTQNNCETECLANYTNARCGCVKFSMPRNRSETKICGWGKIACCEKAEEEMFLEDVIDGMEDGWTKLFREQCNCLPSCTSITYEVEIDRGKIIRKTQRENFYSSDVRIVFNDYKIITLKRSATYTLASFLSNCGGLLGLFLGLSVLSVIEVIYFVSLNMFWYIQKLRSKNAVVPFQPENAETSWVSTRYCMRNLVFLNV